jgi:hypothetical protein
MKTKLNPFPSFQLGQTVATRGVSNSVPTSILIDCIRCHARGDWGDVCEEDAGQNDFAVSATGEDAGRVLSSYPLPAEQCDGETKLWVITEWDRSATTCLFPSEY